MAANVVQAVESVLFPTNDDEPIAIHCQREVIAGLRNFASVPGKKPPAPPNTIEIGFVNGLARIKLSGQRPAGLTLLNQGRNSFKRSCGARIEVTGLAARPRELRAGF